MSYLPPSIDFFLPPVRPRQQETNSTSLYNAAAARVGKFETGVFLHEGRMAPFFVSRAQHERNVVAGITGMNVTDVLEPEDLQKINDRGTTFIWIPLPKPVKGAPINEPAKDIVRAFLTSKNSPAHVLFPHHLPKFIATHSTSGRIVLDLLHEQDTQRKLSHIFAGAVYASPYLDTANSSMTFNPNKDRIFQAFAQHYKDCTPHETRLGRLYMSRAAKNESYKDTKDAGMAYSHILELQNAGRSLLKNFNAQAASSIPSIIVIGDQDPFACPKTTDLISKKMGIEPIVVKGGQHYPFRQDSYALMRVIETLDTWTRQYEQQRQSIQYISSEEYLARGRARAMIEQEIDAELLPPLHENIFKSLGDRLGTALQRSASFLNPAAGIF